MSGWRIYRSIKHVPRNSPSCLNTITQRMFPEAQVFHHGDENNRLFRIGASQRLFQSGVPRFSFGVPGCKQHRHGGECPGDRSPNSWRRKRASYTADSFVKGSSISWSWFKHPSTLGPVYLPGIFQKATVLPAEGLQSPHDVNKETQSQHVRAWNTLYSTNPSFYRLWAASAPTESLLQGPVAGGNRNPAARMEKHVASHPKRQAPTHGDDKHDSLPQYSFHQTKYDQPQHRRRTWQEQQDQGHAEAGP